MNPIFIEYYSHEKADCYKINLPWSEYHTDTMVLCKVSKGYRKARRLAKKVIAKHLRDVTTEGVTK